MRCLLYAVVLGMVGCDSAGTAPAPGPEVPTSASSSSFWSVVDASVARKDDQKSVGALRERLTGLPPERILGIHREFGQHLARSYSWELWGAAYVINGGCSDDCFEYFRAWLIMQGRAVFEATLANPDSLADYAALAEPPELEEALSVTADAYEARTGKEPEGRVAYPTLGPGWDFDDPAEMKRRYPKLCARFSC